MKNCLSIIGTFLLLFSSGSILATNSCDISFDGMWIYSKGAWTTNTGTIQNQDDDPHNYCYTISQSGGFTSTSLTVKINNVIFPANAKFTMSAFQTFNIEISGVVPGTASCGAQNVITISVHTYDNLFSNCTNSNECGATITIQKPLASISGPTSICLGTTGVPYSINYPLSSGTVTWTATNGWTVNGSGTSITLNPGTGSFTTLCASSSSFCNSPCLTVFKGVHFTDAPTPFCEWDIDSWSIAPVYGASSYIWSFTPFSSGATSDGLDITSFGLWCNIEAQHYGSYKVKCTANGCPTLTSSQLTLFVNQPGQGGCPFRLENEHPGRVSKVEAVPNPASSYVDFHFSLVSDDRITWIEIRDISGRTVRHISFDQQALEGDFSIRQDVTDLTPGMYTYVIKGGRENFLGKIVIQ